MPRKRHTLAAPVSVHDSNLYRAIGGTAACRKLSSAFYSRVKGDPLLRPFFPGKSLKCAIEEFAAFLIQFLGGPSEDSQRRWWLSLRESHLRFKIGRKERDAWLKNMVKALDDVPIAEPARGALLTFFERSSAYVVNQGQPPPAAGDGSDPPCDGMRQELARRWDAQRGVDEFVAAVRNGDADRAIALAEGSDLKTCDRAIGVGLLALMVGSGHNSLLECPGIGRSRNGYSRPLRNGREFTRWPRSSEWKGSRRRAGR